MSEEKFTQGEWCVSNGIFVGVKGVKEGDDSIVSGVGILKDAEANAKLIACAPKMYSEIKRDIEWLSNMILTHGQSNPMTATFIQLRSEKVLLLREARGEL